MMSLAMPFEIQNGTEFSLNHLEDVNYPKKGVMVKPYILVVAIVERFALCKNNYAHYVVFEIAI
jgi:hypothetical protein